jgi:hypothetical protein
MDKVKYIEIETIAGKETHAVIDRGDGEFTSMTKELYEAQQATLKPVE